MQLKVAKHQIDKLKPGIIAIAVLLVLTLIFNVNGSLWALVLHPIYQLFFLLVVIVVIFLLTRKDLSLSIFDISIVAIIAYTLVSRSLRLGQVIEPANL